MKKIFCVLLMSVMMAFLTGCGGDSTSNDVTGKDVELSKPDISVATTASSDSERDYGDKLVVNGFWVKECTSGNSKYYRYIPMMTAKIPGIYDFEDEESNVSFDSYISYNRPAGTVRASLRGMSTQLCYFSNAQLGYNSDVSEEAVVATELSRYVEAFSLITLDNGYNSLENFDVGCITFALYKDLYDTFPDMKLLVYGVSSDVLSRKIADLKTCSSTYYVSVLNGLASDYSECELIDEVNITESGRFYIDYKALSERGGYEQYLFVVNVSQKTGFAYYMNGYNCYDIDDADAYSKWKSANISQFIAE